MSIQLQLMRNSLYPLNNMYATLPCIIAKTPQKIYLFNTPQLQRRYLLTHYCKISRPISIFYTTNTVNSFNGIIPFILQIFQRGKAFTTNIYLPNNMYKYFEDSWSRLGHRHLQLSYCNLVDKNQKRLGFNQQQDYRKYLSNIQYWQHRGNLPNQLFIKYTKDSNEQRIKDASKNLLGITKQKQQQQRHYYKDQQMQMRYFIINNSKQQQHNSIDNNNKQYLNYICIPKKTQPRLNKTKIKQYKLEHPEIIKLLKYKQITIPFSSNNNKDDNNENHNQQQKIVKLQQFIIQQGQQTNFMILHYRTRNNLNQILNNPVFKQYVQQVHNKSTSGNIIATTKCIIHVMQDVSIINSQQFIRFLEIMGTQVTHLIDNPNLIDLNQQTNLNNITFPPHFIFTEFINKYYPKYMPNLCRVYFDYLAYTNTNNNIMLTINAVKKIYSNYKFIRSSNYHEFVLKPLRFQGYGKIADNRIDKFVNIQPYQYSQQKKNKQNMVNKEQQKQSTQSTTSQQLNPKVIFLGTSSMISTIYRNVSGIILQISPVNTFLFDCGDGIFQQIINHFGQHKLQQVLNSLRVIFITHLHADHCTGILQIIQQRNNLLKSKKYQNNNNQQQNNNKLFLIIPSNMVQWVHAYQQNIQQLKSGCNIIFVETIGNEEIFNSPQAYDIKNRDKQKNKSLFKKNSHCSSSKNIIGSNQTNQQNIGDEDYSSTNKYKQILQIYKEYQSGYLEQFNKYLQSIKVAEFKPVPVIHCPQSYGIVVKLDDGKKISYSGDCRPTPKFIKEAQNSTLLIHEATFLDNQVKNAKLYKHSTVGQAIDMGMKTNSKMTALTHFSIRRTSKDNAKILVPQLYSYSKDKFKYAKFKTFQCLDHLQFHINQMDQLPVATKFMRDTLNQTENQNKN